MKKLLIISGPTAVGKTKASIEFAKKYSGEIINADSMQVYKGMDIGTAKIKKEEMCGIPHHLFDICDPAENFDVATYKDLANKCIDDINAKGHLPILVGGTGFYIQAVLYDIDFMNSKPDLDYRKELEDELKEKGATYLHDMLKAVDYESAKIIHENNTKRVIRALEFFHTEGFPISIHNQNQREKQSPYDFKYLVFTLPRNILYEKIEMRVDEMIADGLIDEVKRLLDMGLTNEMTSMQGLGYRQIIPYLEEKCSLRDAIYTLKRDTRHFAKRQITWFKREKEVEYLDVRDMKKLFRD